MYVYGGTSAGVMAAYTAKQLHKTVVLIEAGKHLGGLTTGGLGFTHIGNKYGITGLARTIVSQLLMVLLILFRVYWLVAQMPLCKTGASMNLRKQKLPILTVTVLMLPTKLLLTGMLR